MDQPQPALFQYFVAINLSKDDREYKWDPSVVDESVRAHAHYAKSENVRHTLHLTQAILDDTAEAGELNLVQVTTSDIGGKPIIAPLAYLTSGTLYQARLDVQLPDASVAFNLTKGAGPIHILGLHTVAVPFEDLDGSDAADEDADEEEEEEAVQDSENEIEMKENDVDAEAIHSKKSPPETNGHGEAPPIAAPAPAIGSNNDKKRKMDEEDDGENDEPKTNGKAAEAEIGTNGDGAGGIKKPKLVEADEKEKKADDVKVDSEIVGPA